MEFVWRIQMAARVDCRGFDLLGSILSVGASHLAHHSQDATIRTRAKGDLTL
jgi:hypothetical protein